MPITASEARKGLFPLIKQVNDDHDAVEIVAGRIDDEHRLDYVVTEAEIIILAARYHY